MKNGFWRRHNRARNGESSDVWREPILLPHSSPITKLYILHVHQQLHHGGVERTLQELRQRFWITRARQSIHSVIKKLLQRSDASRGRASLWRRPELSSRSARASSTHALSPTQARETTSYLYDPWTSSVPTLLWHFHDSRMRRSSQTSQLQTQSFKLGSSEV